MVGATEAPRNLEGKVHHLEGKVHCLVKLIFKLKSTNDNRFGMWVPYRPCGASIVKEQAVNCSVCERALFGFVGRGLAPWSRVKGRKVHKADPRL